MAIEWQEFQPPPAYHYCSEDGLIDADVEHREYGGGWQWSASIMTWEFQDTTSIKINRPDGSEGVAYLKHNGHGRADSADEAKAAVERWIKERIG